MTATHPFTVILVRPEDEKVDTIHLKASDFLDAVPAAAWQTQLGEDVWHVAAVLDGHVSNRWTDYSTSVLDATVKG